MDGRLIIDRGPGLSQASFESIELRGLGVGGELLAPRPLKLETLDLDGQLRRERGPGIPGARTSGELLVAHAGAWAQITGEYDDEGLRVALDTPEFPCQQLLDALPEGAAPVLAGTELRGELEVHLGLDIEFAELAAARTKNLVDGELVLPEHEAFVPPGELRFDFPVLEACSVERLGPGVDLDGLRGVYHHDFVTGAGRVERRTLAPGDEDFVSLREVPNLELAFVILEDARFWEHDGFDREQLERAFWFNVLEGRVRRGASTISQQTARSLWLGIDRSITRKLAEALIAAELEREVDKRRILEVYLNIIELGPEIHGVAEAARYHFGKDARELELHEALHLASLAPAPVAYSRRFADGDIDQQWRAHLRHQVHRLRIRHLITRERANSTNAARLELLPHPEL
nr:biosynthetic peptidoglycan transglycosylase [Pseudenhygromyxa sp. WMMC2535]